MQEAVKLEQPPDAARACDGQGLFTKRLLRTSSPPTSRGLRHETPAGLLQVTCPVLPVLPNWLPEPSSRAAAALPACWQLEPRPCCLTVPCEWRKSLMAHGQRKAQTDTEGRRPSGLVSEIGRDRSKPTQWARRRFGEPTLRAARERGPQRQQSDGGDWGPEALAGTDRHSGRPEAGATDT